MHYNPKLVIFDITVSRTAHRIYQKFMKNHFKINTEQDNKITKRGSQLIRTKILKKSIIAKTNFLEINKQPLNQLTRWDSRRSTQFTKCIVWMY